MVEVGEYSPGPGWHAPSARVSQSEFRDLYQALPQLFLESQTERRVAELLDAARADNGRGRRVVPRAWLARARALYLLDRALLFLAKPELQAGRLSSEWLYVYIGLYMYV